MDSDFSFFFLFLCMQYRVIIVIPLALVFSLSYLSYILFLIPVKIIEVAVVML